jgi:uncharacterized membrane protein YraQ (UPF0718 family)/YHS domain-containing protein
MAIDPICGMKVNEKTGFKIMHKGKPVYFCSVHCRDKYIKENKIKSVVHCETCAVNVPQPIYKNKIFVLSMIVLLAYLSGYFYLALAKLQMILGMYLLKIALPVLLGLVLGGVIDWGVPREYISHLLAGTKKRTILRAVLTGFLMSACSHGILALTIQLYKKGASAPAAVAFLLASPWANLPVTFLMFGFFGWKALLIIFSAILVALVTGNIMLVMQRHDWIETNPNTTKTDKNFSISKDLKKRISKIKIGFRSSVKALVKIWEGTVALANMVLWWILLGALISSVAGAFIPEHFMRAYMGASVIGLVVTLFVATIMEICSEGTAPLAFEIYRQTGAFGNAFVFLMAGVVTDYTEIGLLWTNIGRRTAFWMPALTVPQVILLGVIFNKFF